MNNINLADHGIFVKNNYGLFYGGVLSNWYRCKFTVDKIKFTSTEQYFMWCKAKIFNDELSANKILATNDPRKQKAIGRSVKNYDDTTWNTYRAQCMMEGILEKFLQNKKLRQILLATDNLILAEASPIDKIWGIGLAVNDPDAFDSTKWTGTNYLGLTLMDVREFIKLMEK